MKNKFYRFLVAYIFFLITAGYNLCFVGYNISLCLAKDTKTENLASAKPIILPPIIISTQGIGYLEQELSSLKNTISAIERERIILEDEISVLEEQNELLGRQKILSIQGQKSRAGDLEEDLLYLRKRINSLDTEKRALKYKLELFQKQNPSLLQDRINALEKEISTLEEKLTTFKEEKPHLQSKLNLLRKDKDNLKSRLDTLQKQKETLKNKIDSLEKENSLFKIQLDYLASRVREYKGEKLTTTKELSSKQLASIKHRTHYNRGYTYARGGKIDEAIKEYQKALEYDPDDIDSHYNLGCLYATKGNFDKAVKEYEEVLVKDPKDKEVYYNLALIYYKGFDRKDMAKEYYQEFLKENLKEND